MISLSQDIKSLSITRPVHSLEHQHKHARARDSRTKNSDGTGARPRTNIGRARRHVGVSSATLMDSQYLADEREPRLIRFDCYIIDSATITIVIVRRRVCVDKKHDARTRLKLDAIDHHIRFHHATNSRHSNKRAAGSIKQNWRLAAMPVGRRLLIKSAYHEPAAIRPMHAGRMEILNEPIRWVVGARRAPICGSC